MSDPPMLRDGTDAKFKVWKTEMKWKLLLNEDYYPKTTPQLAYVSSLCEGKALRHISPRLQEDYVPSRRVREDVCDHLQSVFYILSRSRWLTKNNVRLKWILSRTSWIS